MRLLVLFFCLLGNVSYSISNADTLDKFSAYISIGEIAYRDSYIIPGGLPGYAYGFGLERSNLTRSKNYELSLNMDFKHASLYNKQSPDFKNPYILYAFKSKCRYAKNIYSISNSFKIKCGVECCFNGFYANSNRKYLESNGNWNLSFNSFFGLSYDKSRWRIEGRCSIPIAIVGYFPPYQEVGNDKNSKLTYFLKVNTVTSVRRYFEIDRSVSIAYKLKKRRIGLCYSSTYLRYDIHETECLLTLNNLGFFYTF